ncbi:MAG: SRPBCC domain-containing protein [Chloroflexi bacterium]|nr:SRPBCC domain-containing protein [Chloroflexota bacterium]
MSPRAVTEIGPLSVRRAILVHATPQRVWKEFESFERMAAWWGTGHTLEIYEPREGGRIEMSVDVDGEMRRFGGAILVFDPGNELTFEDNWVPQREWPMPVFITLRLTPHHGGTLVELLVHGFERFGERAAERHRGLETGWSIRQLARLAAIIES